MKKTIINIKENGDYVFGDIQGTIKKIYIESTEPMSAVDITFISAEQETLHKSNIENNIMVIYPYNFIDVQGRGAEFYSFGPVAFRVEGLVDGQEINKISIFYN